MPGPYLALIGASLGVMLVGDTGFEPVTLRVGAASRARRPLFSDIEGRGTAS
jgi:hypothetical protein